MSHGARRIALAAVAVCVCAGCRALPEPPTEPVAAKDGEFRIESGHGELGRRAARALVARIAADPAGGDALARHLSIEQGVSPAPLFSSNSVRLLRDGEQTFPAMFAALKAATHQIHLEYYIFEDIEWDGDRLSDVLLAKRAAGVEVNVIYDSVGSSSTPREFLDRLRQAGVRMLEYHPLNPAHGLRTVSLNDRDHRKLLVVDGARAIVGGVNMSHTYERAPATGAGSEAAVKENAPTHWRDTDAEILGPAVAELERLFVAHWTRESKEPVATALEFPRLDAQGDQVVRIIGSAPAHRQVHYYLTVLTAIDSAREAIWLTTGYFVPTHRERASLTAAAHRGVDVRLLVPSVSDSPAALTVQRASYGDLLQAGVHIYEAQNVILHSKSVVVDRVWSAIGSSNFDHRSALFNDELDAVIVGHSTAERLESLLREDFAEARAVDRDAWRHRGVTERLKEAWWRLWQTLL